MNDIASRLKASVGLGAVHGDFTERNVCESQMREAAQRLEILEHQHAEDAKTIQRLRAQVEGLSAEAKRQECRLRIQHLNFELDRMKRRYRQSRSEIIAHRSNCEQSLKRIDAALAEHGDGVQEERDGHANG